MQISVVFEFFLLLFLFKFLYFIKNTNCNSQLWFHGQPWVTTLESVDLEERVPANIQKFSSVTSRAQISPALNENFFGGKNRPNLQKYLPIDPDVPFIGIYLTNILTPTQNSVQDSSSHHCLWW